MSEQLIAIVGVCASGKTTLVNALRLHGYRVRQVSQEHSYVPDMWLRVTGPDLLIYLDASLESIRLRRRDQQWPRWLRERQIARLRHARSQCDLYILTDLLVPEKVCNLTLAFLRTR
jgi:deoxyadenosine/deoxycytidine kinase